MSLKGLLAIDDLAIASARDLAARQPRCDYTIDQLNPLVLPDKADELAVWHQATGRTEKATLATLGAFFGNSGFGFAFNSNLLPLIFNYGFYADTPGQPNAVNTSALARMFADMAAPVTGLIGGMAWIPNYQFPVNATGNGLLVPDQSIIQGLGSGGAGAAQFLITGTTGLGDLFLALGPAAHSEGGIFLRNIGFQWVNPTVVGNSTTSPDTAVNLETWGGKIQDCVFIDCPTAVGFSALDNTGLGCTMERCVVHYGVHATCPDNAVMIIMSGEQAQILGPCEFLQKPFINSGPNGVTGLGWGGGTRGSEHQIVSGCHFADFQWGIDFSNRRGLQELVGGAVDWTLRDCELNNYSTCLNLSNDVVNANIVAGNVLGNTFSKSKQSQNDSNPIVLIDSLNETGGGNSNIAFVNFIGNQIYSNVTSGGPSGSLGIAANNQYGVEIRGGSGIQFIGGKIGQVGNKATNTGGTWSDGSANVCITGGTIGGGPGNVTFSSVVLGPNYSSIFGGGTTGAGPTQYGVLIKGNFVNGPVAFNNCPLSGFSGTGQAALHVNAGATVGNGCLFFNNCPGYNDAQTNLLGTGTIQVGVPFKAATATTDLGSGGGPVNYYGPSLFTGVSAGGTLSISGKPNQSLLVAQFLCIPLGPYDTLQFSAPPTNPIWVGK